MSDTSIKRFNLRPLEKSDLGSVAGWFRDVEDLALFDRSARAPMNLAQIEEAFGETFARSKDPAKLWFAIEEGGPAPLGIVGLEEISHVNRDAVVPVFVDKSLRRNGVALRAIALVLDLAFRQLGLNRITSYYRADNHISRDLISQLGCQIEGRMRQAWFADGQFHDMVVVGLLREEWMERRQSLATALGPETVVSFGAQATGTWCWPPD